jgi:spore germination cell wall hydrolase CwlJ-like protein
MSLLKCWIRGTFVLLALATGVQAETTVSKSNDPRAMLDTQLSSLLSAERSGFEALSDAALAGLVALPAANTAAAKKAAKPAVQPTFDEAWLASLARPTTGPELSCLATAVYFEARGESVKGQAAVAEVVLNRAESGLFPSSICGVVKQSGNGGCQFSFACDGKSDRIRDKAAWDAALRIAGAMMAGAPRTLTDGATYFHTPAVRPDWSRRFERTAKIGYHIFYRAPIRTAMN